MTIRSFAKLFYLSVLRQEEEKTCGFRFERVWPWSPVVAAVNLPKSAQISRIIELPKKPSKPSRWVIACLPRARPPMPPAPAASRLQRQRIHAGGNTPLETCLPKDISLCLCQKKGNIRLKISGSAFYSENFFPPSPVCSFWQRNFVKTASKGFFVPRWTKKTFIRIFSPEAARL